MVFKNLIMKKYIYILIFIPFLTFSQGINLELNQVLLLDVSSESQLYTVPEGKTWKITSALHNLSLGGNSFYGITINDVDCKLGSSSVSSSEQVYTISKDSQWKGSFPIWIPAGTTINGNGSIKFLSVLEFNAQ
tara:strand:- start:812 stop:1213 length:402 start_codon:yes stop_codon:yes gene_type:complete